jgi:hypothetical protein
VIAPVGFEFRGAADAFEFGDLLEQMSEPGDEHGDGREPVRVSVIVLLKRRSFEAHGRDYKYAGRLAGLRCGSPHILAGKWLSVLEKIALRPPNLRTRLPAKWDVTLALRTADQA